eukprot:7343212-Prymnesium_polylepis.1
MGGCWSSSSTAADDVRLNKAAPSDEPSAEPPPEPTLVSFAGIALKVPDAEDDPRWCGKGMPALHKAAKAGDLEQLAQLVGRAGCSIDEKDAGESALHLAAEEGHTEAVLMLLEHGADVNGTTDDGWTALHCAAQSENADVVALLLSRGADLHARTQISATALHCAAFNGRLDAAKVLILRGADVHAHDKDGWTPLDDARHKVRACPCIGEEAKRRWGAVIAFLERVMPMAADERREFAARSWGLFVTSALQEASQQGELGELTLLLECYALEVDARDHDGSTALHAAAEGGHTEALSILLERGASVDVRANYDDTALHFAAREGHLAVARLLVERGADARATNRFGATALDYARRGKNDEWEAVCKLLEEGVAPPHEVEEGGAAGG